ncbi:hypothetical protein [uncultured Nocardioides sp.]|uniref:hypothetical protein n=1 Tax=uncultured Nocardioides sp. TaxID=198441 RepID=UPI0026163933|nr:hypothetical protein [uncultured Nocardioides sp.]MCK5928740.1 hypothetical protein [Nocardioides sp.]
MADRRHKRDTDARRTPRATLVAGPLALVATASVISLGVVLSDAPASETITARTTAADLQQATGGSGLGSRDSVLSRSSDRSGLTTVEGATLEKAETKLDRVLAKKAVEKAIAKADTKLWTTAPLNLWTEPGEKAKKVGTVAAERKVLVTGRELYGRDEVVIDGKARWVTRGYLQEEKPETGPATASASASCTNGSSVPAGVSPNIAAVHRAVCAQFPSITSYGTFRSGGGDHGRGLAVDIMVSGELGWQVAEFVRANAGQLGVSYAIYSQRIWSVERGGEGWRPMSDRGSATANHYDHVHVSTF